MIDLHFYGLWNRDGGVVPWSLCLARLQEAYNAGVTDLVATPYICKNKTDLAWQDIKAQVQAVQARAVAAGVPVRLYAGAELELDEQLWQFLRQSPQAYCLAGSHYVLLSLHRHASASFVENMLYDLMIQGYLPIIARPELTPYFCGHPRRLLQWMHQGALLQCDWASVAGVFGDSARRHSLEFVKHHMVTLLGSGTEAAVAYGPTVPAAEKAITAADIPWQTWGKCISHGERVLGDQLFYPLLPECWEPPRLTFFSRLFGL